MFNNKKIKFHHISVDKGKYEAAVDASNAVSR